MKAYSSKQVLFFIVGIHIVYFLAACYFKGIFLIDSYGYLMQADNIRSLGTWYAENWNTPLLIDYFSIRPPLYAWIIIALRAIWDNIFFVLIVQNGLSILNGWLVFLFVKKQAGESKRMQLFCVLGLLFYPAQMMHANFVMTEIFFQTLLVFIFINTYRFVENPCWKYSLHIAILLSLCLLTKPVSLFLPFVVLGCMGSAMIKQTQNLKYSCAFIVIVLVFHGICLQNKHATGYYHYSSIKTINQLKYNARYTLVNAEGELYADSVITDCLIQANAMADYGERLQWMDAKALEIIKTYPGSFLKLYTKGILAFFIDPGRFDVYHFLAIDEKGAPGLMYEIQTSGYKAIFAYLNQAPLLALVILVVNFCWNLFVVACFVYFSVSKRFPASMRLILCVLVLYIAAATGPVGVSRYRVPVYPFLWMAVLFVSPQRGIFPKGEKAD
jgi:hypothetical protein